MNGQRIVLTLKGEEVGAAYGLENVYRAYAFIQYDSWRYQQNGLPAWITAEAWDGLVSAKQRLNGERPRTLAEQEPSLRDRAKGVSGCGEDA
jgi:hypothetical protein